MVHERGLRGERLTASLALVRPLARMRSQMSLKVGLRRERLAAHVANVPQVRVRSPVVVQRGVAVADLVAPIALKFRPNISVAVRPLVPQSAVVVQEVFAANFAGVLLARFGVVDFVVTLVRALVRKSLVAFRAFDVELESVAALVPEELW